MFIYEDTRQQEGKHKAKHRWFEAHGIELVRVAMTDKGHANNPAVAPSGDYCREGSNISVDTKASLQEILRNLTRDHKRIVREIQRCTDAGYRLVFLIDTPHATSIDDLYGWTNDYCRFRCDYYKQRMCNPHKNKKCLQHRSKPVQGNTLASTMKTMEDRYGARFYFCAKKDAAMRICELLGVDYDE